MKWFKRCQPLEVDTVPPMDPHHVGLLAWDGWPDRCWGQSFTETAAADLHYAWYLAATGRAAGKLKALEEYVGQMRTAHYRWDHKFRIVGNNWRESPWPYAQRLVRLELVLKVAKIYSLQMKQYREEWPGGGSSE
jgi:hypothetical protein